MVLEKTLRYVVLGGIFLLPFVAIFVSESLFFPFITGKNFAFRLIVEIITAAYLALSFVRSDYRPRRSWALLALAVFLFVIALADLFGAYPMKSFWSNYERMDGWVTLAHLFVYVVIAASMMNTEKLWRWLLWVSLGVSVYLALYGFLQVVGLSTLGQGGAAGLSARIDATFGNPIYLAAYMLFHIFIAAIMWSQSWMERARGSRLAPSLAYGSIIVIDTLALLFTGTRGTMIGLFGGALLSALILVILARNSRVVWRFAFATVVVIVFLAGAFWTARDQAWVKKIGFLERLATISTSDPTVKARFINWSIAWEGVKERPILGWGQENYAIVFDKYYDPRMYAQEPWFDRVHNIVFDWLVAGGFLGLLSYLSIFLATLWLLWHRSVNEVHAFSIPERSLLTGLLAAYFCHNFFVFDNVTSYILFGTILGYVIFRTSKHSKASILFGERFLFPVSALPYITVGAAILLWGVAWTVNAQALVANRAIIAALNTQGDASKTLAAFKRSISYGTYGSQEAREQLAQAATQAASLSIPNTTKQQFYDVATSELQLQAKASPLDARFPLFLGVVYEAYGNNAAANDAFTQALKLSPRKQRIFFEIGQNALRRGDLASALNAFKEAHELAPQFLEPTIYYAAVLIRAGDFTKSDALLEPYIATGEAADPRTLAAYIDRKRYDKVAKIWQALVATNPQDVQPYFTLAALYYQSGDKARAIEALEAAKRAHPEVKTQADELIGQIRSGSAQVQ
ncbi:O-antigen ligase family protein [Candidatus Kaiserbacteria bacterium]|nr:O-antigen ligase family protein [Candidatus Kaiserbacteria bacterium]